MNRERETELPSFAQSLHAQDLGFLRIVAGFWGIELAAREGRTALRALASEATTPERVQGLVAALPAEARLALASLAGGEGKLPWSLYTRRFGVVREMGPGKRDRELPFQNPVSAAEALHYRGLVGRAFFDSALGPQEFAFIPSDLFELLGPLGKSAAPVLGRPALPAERSQVQPAQDRLLDWACSYLAALRSGVSPETWEALAREWREARPPATDLALAALLRAAGLIDGQGQPDAEAVRLFLEAGRAQALVSLVTAWLRSPDFDELRLMPGLELEGSLNHHPLRTRQLGLYFLSLTPQGAWWSLPAFLAAVKEQFPDFQRPAGDYDSWFVRRAGEKDFLRGFQHWDLVDGALLQFLIGGPLHWLGLVDLGFAEPGGPPTAFRTSAWYPDLIAGCAPDRFPQEAGRLQVGSDGRLRAPRGTPRAIRYQVARFAEWEEKQGDDYRYRITPASLEKARRQGLKGGHLLGLLRRSAGSLPPSFARAVERWEIRGVEARLERMTVLRLSNPELLKALQSSRAGRFLEEPLGPTAVVVKPGAWKEVLAALTEMGYLGEVKDLEEKEAP